MLLCATGPPSPLPYLTSSPPRQGYGREKKHDLGDARESARLRGRLPAFSKGSVAMASALFGAGVCQAVRPSAVSTHGGRNLEHTTRRRLKQHRVGMSRYVLLLARTMYAPSSMARSRAQLGMHPQVRVGGKTCSALGPRSDLPFSINCQLGHLVVVVRRRGRAVIGWERQLQPGTCEDDSKNRSAVHTRATRHSPAGSKRYIIHGHIVVDETVCMAGVIVP